MHSLEVEGLVPALITEWEESLGEELLEVQAEAVRAGVCRGANLVVSSPAGSGKTFVGELAAAAAVLRGEQTVYLVPTRALAEEKYEEFATRYEPLGVRVVVSTRERREHDGRVAAGDFDLLVAVNEKARALLVRRPEMWRRVGLVVVDEVQMLSDRARGPCLELILTGLRLGTERTQIVALSASLEGADELAAWLGAELVRVERRPVELRQGVFCGGRFRYVECNNGGEGYEELGEEAEYQGLDWAGTVVKLVEGFRAEGEQTLVFVRDRRGAERLALAIAENGGERSQRGSDVLAAQEPTLTTEALAEALEMGAAFHHAGLPREARVAVEQAFARGDVEVLVSTSTLALGVNLPARNVIVDAVRWDTDSDEGRPVIREITPAEFPNMAGRAGRPGRGLSYGRAMVVAERPLTAEVYWQNLIQGEKPVERPALLAHEGDEVAVWLTALAEQSGGLKLEGVLPETFSGWMAKQASAAGGAAVRIEEAAERCRERGLLRESQTAGGRELTKLGQVCAGQGLAATTCEWLRRTAEAFEARQPTETEALLVVAVCEEVQRLPSGQRREGAMAAGKREAEEEVGGELEAMLSTLDPAAQGEAHRVAGILGRWIGGEPTRELEQDSRLHVGTLAELGATAGWLLEAWAAIAQEEGRPEAMVRMVRELATRTAAGLSSEAAGLARLRHEGLSRRDVEQLAGAGYRTMGSIREATEEALSEVLTEAVVSAWRERKQTKPRSARGRKRSRGRRTRQQEGAAADVERKREARQDSPQLLIEDRRPDRVVFYGKEVPITATELSLLRALAERPGQCVSYDEISQALWGDEVYPAVPRDRIQVHGARLRSKLVAAAPQERRERPIIANVSGRGYILNLARVVLA